jgi:hypothetical protein
MTWMRWVSYIYYVATCYRFFCYDASTIVEANQIIHRPPGIEKGTIAAHRNFASKLQHHVNISAM